MDKNTSTDLVQHINALPLIDTHEHLHKEAKYVKDGPDVLADLFGMYIGDELIVAGAAYDNVVRLLDPTDADIEARWSGVEAAWQLCQYSGYGEAVRYMAKAVYDIDTLTLDAIEAAGSRNQALRQPGERLRLLRDVANLDHVQVDDFVWPCLPDASGPSFFLYDFSWVDFVSVRFDVNTLEAETGIATTNLKTLKQAMEALTAKYAPVAIAMKIQHAYYRTLAWSARDDADAEKALQKYLADEPLSDAERLCLGDWNLERGIELAIKYHLPIKIHTGFLAGHQRYFTHPDQTRAGHLAPLLAYFPEATFVLMHIAYPYSDELIAIAKHFPGVHLDMCWAWSINPYHAAEFVRKALHGLPLNKLFAFGGDCVWPTEVVGFATQARQWLAYALQQEITDAHLSEAQAIQIATRMMQTNQRAVFDIEGTRSAIVTLGV